MVSIENDDDAYVAWLERNPEGFVVNLRSAGKTRARLHGARRRHLYPPDPGVVHTGSYPKACARSCDEVERWARAAHYTVDPCPDCLR